MFVDRARIAAPLAGLTSLAGDIDSFRHGTLAPLAGRPRCEPRRDPRRRRYFLWRTRWRLLERAARFDLPSAGLGFRLRLAHTAFADLLAQVAGLVTRWDAEAARLRQRLERLRRAARGHQRRRSLRRAAGGRAARQLAARPVAGDPRAPARGADRQARRPSQSRRGEFQIDSDQWRERPSPTLFAAVGALLPAAEFDSQPFDVSPFGDRADRRSRRTSRAHLTSQLVGRQDARRRGQTPARRRRRRGLAGRQVAALRPPPRRCSATTSRSFRNSPSPPRRETSGPMPSRRPPRATCSTT